jgi:hypothetical protein
MAEAAAYFATSATGATHSGSVATQGRGVYFGNRRGTVLVNRSTWPFAHQAVSLAATIGWVLPTTKRGISFKFDTIGTGQRLRRYVQVGRGGGQKDHTDTTHEKRSGTGTTAIRNHAYLPNAARDEEHTCTPHTDSLIALETYPRHC